MQAARAARVAIRRLALALVACGSVLHATSVARAQAECLGFEERTIVDEGTNGLTAVEVADLDADSDLDIVTGAFGDNKVVWYENDPSHPEGFRPHLVSDRVFGAADVHIQDVNADGRPDLVAAARSSNSVIWFENAPGSPPLFIARTIDTSARIVLGVHAADVNGDGLVDLLSASYLSNTVAWYEQVPPPEPEEGEPERNDPPTFTKHVVTVEAHGAAAVFAADLDGDSDADVLSASRLDSTVAWYRNDLDDDDDETPDFAPMVLSTTFAGATAVIAADLDRDGDPDVIAAAPEDFTVAWWPNGGGTFPPDPSTITTTAQGVRSLEVADVDGDGDLDVLSASDRDDTIAWYENHCSTPAPQPCGALSPFVEHVVSTTATHASDVAAGELDGSTGVDVVSVSGLPGFPASQDKLAWYSNVAAALPDLPLEARIGRAADGAVAAFAADLDGDSDVDVATAGRTNRITWYENDGTQKAEAPTFAENVISTNAVGAVDIHGADLDCDRDIDLVSASADDDKIAWYENDGAPEPTFVEHSPVSTTADEARDVFVVDLDGDSDLDILSASSADGKIAWYENDCPTDTGVCQTLSGCGAPNFTEHVITEDDPDAETPVVTGARSVHAADIDGDSDLDVLAALYTVSRVRWYENGLNDTPPAPWVEHDVLSASGGQFAITGATSTFGADIDGDSDTDVIATAGPSRLVLWLESDGAASPTFASHVLASDANDASSAYAFDIDSDGDQDILAAVPGDGVIAWFENNGAQPPAFSINLVAQGTDYALSSTVANVNGDSTDDDPPIELYDIVAGERTRVSWFKASGEICQTFDMNDDDRIDGVELAYIGRAFGLSDPAPGVWWERADLNRDGIIDGDDLAYLGSSGVFGFSTTECSLICR